MWLSELEKSIPEPEDCSSEWSEESSEDECWVEEDEEEEEEEDLVSLRRLWVAVF